MFNGSINLVKIYSVFNSLKEQKAFYVHHLKCFR